VSFRVLAVASQWLVLQRIVLAAERDITARHFAWGYDRAGGPKVTAAELRFATGQIVRATVLRSSLWQVGASIPADIVLARCRPE
jgi:hypothetical protein